MAGKYKIEVHLKNEKSTLTYYPSDADGAWNNWFQFLNDDKGCIAFGRFIVPKSEILYVEHHEVG